MRISIITINNIIIDKIRCLDYLKNIVYNQILKIFSSSLKTEPLINCTHVYSASAEHALKPLRLGTQTGPVSTLHLSQEDLRFHCCKDSLSSILLLKLTTFRPSSYFQFKMREEKIRKLQCIQRVTGLLTFFGHLLITGLSAKPFSLTA